MGVDLQIRPGDRLGAPERLPRVATRLREAKVTQVFEGTNQIQRLVIGRDLDRRASSALTSNT